MNNEPVALTQGDILGILQDANSVPLGQPIFNSSEEYNKLKAIIESAIRYTHPSEHDLGIAEAIGFDKGYKAATAKTLTDDEIISCIDESEPDTADMIRFARALLKKASEK
jgi:hypothetical protein